MKRLVAGAVLVLAGACSGQQMASVPPAPAAPAAPAVPEAVNGWREYPLRSGVVSIQSDETWKSDVIKIPVKAGVGLEYKLDMQKGQGIVYTISYDGLDHPGLMEVEFHGHTPKDATGVGDLMFYSKTGGSAQSGVFTAPWDGIHGWYLKNDGAKDVTVKLEVAGFYALQKK